ncbi:phosphate uptake regulator PhoU, partial [Planctomycetota bacterium]
MFRHLRHLQQHQSTGGFVERVTGEFLEMLDLAETMFVDVCIRLLDHQREPHLGDRIYDIDARINQLEKTIRRQIVEHLALQPKADLPICLALMSLVKDAERLGDYIKNLYQVDQVLDAPIDNNHFTTYFGSMSEDIKALFQTTRTVLTEDLLEATHETREQAHRIEKTCDEIIARLAHCDLTVNEAVAFTLTARHFKRAAAHLNNILTSV